MKSTVSEGHGQSDKKVSGIKRQKAAGAASAEAAPALSIPHLRNDIDDQLRTVFELTSDGVVIIEDGHIKACNQQFAAMSGHQPGELIESPLAMFLEIASTPVGKPQHRIGNPAGLETAHFVGRDGHRCRVRFRSGTVDFRGRRSDIMFIAKVAEPIQTDDDIQKTRKLESIAALSGGIAHDYNNLLTVIIGNISLIQSYMDSEDIIYRMLSEAYEASMIAKSLTQKLITFSKGGAPIKETALLSPLVKSATEFTLSGSNVKSAFLIADDLYLVEIDKTQIGQAIHNLVMNAREAMPRGGTLTVKAENITVNRKTPDLNRGKYVKISFSDQGVGIPTENLEKIFDPYFSTKQRGTQKGMGLGLSICHSIIDKHCGAVTAESGPGVGTTISILLPASTEKKIEKKTAPTAASRAVPVPGRGRILVMDDEKMIVKLTSLILSRLGYQAEFAADGSEAVEMYRTAMESDQPFDAVILDLTVRGGMGGKETIVKLLAMDPAVKGIVSSGYSDDPVMEDYQKYGFKGVVVKPFSIHELSENLSHVLAG